MIKVIRMVGWVEHFINLSIFNTLDLKDMDFYVCLCGSSIIATTIYLKKLKTWWIVDKSPLLNGNYCLKTLYRQSQHTINHLVNLLLQTLEPFEAILN